MWEKLTGTLSVVLWFSKKNGNNPSSESRRYSKSVMVRMLQQGRYAEKYRLFQRTGYAEYVPHKVKFPSYRKITALEIPRLWATDSCQKGRKELQLVQGVQVQASGATHGSSAECSDNTICKSLFVHWSGLFWTHYRAVWTWQR